MPRFRQRFTKTSNNIELIEMLRDILPFDDYKVASVEGNKKNFKAVIECKHRRFTGCDQSVYDTIQPEDK